MHTIGSFPLEVTLAKFLQLLEASEPADIQIESHPSGFVRNNVAWVTDLPRFRMPSGETRRGRQTIVMIELHGAWKVVHSHLSRGVVG
ncbi:SnoaL-like domain-containing protein [Actinacidiphila alni]|uniref:SnoaL-like domain-containing protein n=1 Tax=Actinacidiphila alni TaxID=380248 RepID=A0A1I2LBD5_9ACTN|nr:SnoaL-like domain-containing protein [Actinacidiphila alni]